MDSQEFTTEELASEIWKPVKGFSFYSVSTLGRVMRTQPAPGATVGRILKGAIDKDGYCKVTLYKGHGVKGEFKSIFVHKVVLGTFVGSPPPEHQVNHIDRIRNNNRLTNLEYLTLLENVQHSIEQLRAANPKGVNHGNARIDDNTVRAIRRMRLTGASFTQIGKAFDVDRMTAFHIHHRTQWKHVAD